MPTRSKSANFPARAARVARVEVKDSADVQDKSGTRRKSEIAPAKGKLGVMIPGMGAVATTFVAGVEAVRQGIAKPIGSLTQMGTIRLGKRTDGRSPAISEGVPLAGLDQPPFGGGGHL